MDKEYTDLIHRCSKEIMQQEKHKKRKEWWAKNWMLFLFNVLNFAVALAALVVSLN